MECSCQFASQSNFSGSYVSALIKISTKTDRTAFGHVSGFLQVDSRWMKSNNNMIHHTHFLHNYFQNIPLLDFFVCFKANLFDATFMSE